MARETRYCDEGSFDETTAMDDFRGEVCASACVVKLVGKVVNRRTLCCETAWVYKSRTYGAAICTEVRRGSSIAHDAPQGNSRCTINSTNSDEFSNAFLQNVLLHRSVVTQSLFTSLVQRL